MRRAAAAAAAILAAGAMSGSWGSSAAAAATPRLAVGDVKVVEGHSSTRNAVFSVTLSRPAPSRVTISYRTGNGSARAGSDYSARTGSVAIAAGRTSATIKVPVSGDIRREAHETFKVRLTAARGATITRSRGTATILNDDTNRTASTTPKVSIGDASVVEGDQRGRYLQVPLTLSAKAAGTVSVRYRTEAVTASSRWGDFLADSGIARIPAGATGTRIAILVNGDTRVEANETFQIRLTAAAGATLYRTRGRATIVNDDTTPPTTTAPPTTSPAPATTTTGPPPTTAAPTTTTTAAPPAGPTAWGWGINAHGELGDGTWVNRSSPVQAGSTTTWATISAGANHTCATRTDGTAWCWGFNENGELGDGTDISRNSPVQVAGGATNWNAVSAGGYHTCATRTDGTLWCWGDNTYGQIGDGTTTLRNSPVQVGNAANWATIGAGSENTCATRTDGTLWCWGNNAYGMVGDGTTTQRTSPVQVAGGATNWAGVSGGALFACATRTDGTAWCWGTNDFGQLGDGSTTDRWTPTPVGGGATNWTGVSAQGIHACGTRSDGTAWCWGYNDFGQLGDGTTTQRTSPVQVGSATNWTTIDAGGLHTAGIRDP